MTIVWPGLTGQLRRVRLSDDFSYFGNPAFFPVADRKE
jgi:hypothetical protein